MTGMQYADILRDAYMLSGGALQYAWVRAWKTKYGVPLCIAAAEAADAAGEDGLLCSWLNACARSFRGRYTIRAVEFARAMDDAADALYAAGAALFPAAAHNARDAQTFDAWSTAAYAAAVCTLGSCKEEERVFLPWLRAMAARFAQA